MPPPSFTCVQDRSLIALQGLFTYGGATQTLFGTAPLSLSAWGAIAGCAALRFAAVEAEKARLRRFARRAR